MSQRIDPQEMVQGYLGSGDAGAVDTTVRDSRIQWLSPERLSEPVRSHLFTLATAAATQCQWDFELESLANFAQAATYDGAGFDHFEWHMDWGAQDLGRRKVTLIAHLSPATAYKGGSLQLMVGNRPVAVSQEPGTVTAFPSFVLHRVTPVVEGSRTTLVAWALGPPFR